MEYNTWSPSEDLLPLIKCFWILRSPAEAEPQKQRIIPDGCMEMIFHCGGLYRQYISATESIVQPRSFVFGQITRNLDIEPTGETDIFAVRFQPYGFNPLATISLQKMANRAVPLTELFGIEGGGLEQQILLEQTTEARISLVEEFVRNRLNRPDVIDTIVRKTVQTMLKLRGNLSVGELSGALQVNRRQLERKCASAIGLSPKQLSRIIRLQAILNQLIHNDFQSFTELAQEGEYYDQAHFINDFKDFTGVSPRQFYAENMKLTRLFYQDS